MCAPEHTGQEEVGGRKDGPFPKVLISIVLRLLRAPHFTVLRTALWSKRHRSFTDEKTVAQRGCDLPGPHRKWKSWDQNSGLVTPGSVPLHTYYALYPSAALWGATDCPGEARSFRADTRVMRASLPGSEHQPQWLSITTHRGGAFSPVPEILSGAACRGQTEDMWQTLWEEAWL